MEKEFLGTVNGKEFLKELKMVLPAISKYESRPILTGILMEFKKDNLTLSTCDSHRLHTIDCQGNFEKELSIVVKGKELKGIKQSMLSEDTKLFHDEKNFYMVGKEEITVSKLQGEYPGIDRLIPTNFTTEIKVNLKELNECLKEAKAFMKENKLNISPNVYKVNGIRVRINQSQMNIQVYTSKENFEKEITLNDFQGEELEISFNYQYMLDTLKGLNKKSTLTIKFVSPVRPFTVTSDMDNEFLGLLTPIRTR